MNFLTQFKNNRIDMGSKHTASCECGFSTEVSVGGSRSSFTTHSYFPFLCKQCGIVSVNVAKENIVCPTCQSEDVEQYGVEGASDLKLKQSNPYPRLQNYDREAFQNGHKCPQCKKFTLTFSTATVRYS